MVQRSALHVQLLDRLAEIAALAGAHKCALLTYPAHGNLGDQPIVLSGGGQLGDQWPRLQAFIEWVVNGLHHNAVIIFP